MMFSLTKLACVLALALPLVAGSARAAELPRQVELELSEGTWMSVDVSPDGRTIAFDLLNDIYVMPATGGKAIAFQTGAPAQHTPKFSHDGELIAYISDESGASNIWVSRPNGEGARQVTFETKDKVAAPSWAPDGKSIAAVVTRSNVFQIKNSEIRRFYLDGSESEVLSPPPVSGRDIQEPAFSPDGNYLYYTERVAGDHYVYMNTALKNFVVRRRDITRGESKTFAAGFGGATTPQVSPDGDKVAFIRRLGAKTALFVMNADGETQNPVYDGLSRDLHGDYLPQEHYYPAFDWFPDNRRIAIWSKGRLLAVDTETRAVEEIPFQLTARHEIMPAFRVKQDLDHDVVHVRTIRQVSLHPSGASMLFRAAGGVWRQALSIDAAPERLTPNDVSAWDPRWSPGGQSFAYVHWNDETGSTLRLRNADGRETIIAATRGVIREPRFSPDGKRIAYRIVAPDASMNAPAEKPGLYLIDTNGGDARWAAPAARLLRFGPDGGRLFYIGEPDFAGKRAVILRSVSLEGDDVRDHAYSETADISDLQISPDLNWLSFKEFHLPYVTPFSLSNGPARVTAIDNSVAQRLHDIGAYEIEWSTDSKHLFWMLGPELYRADPKTGEAAVLVRRISIQLPADRPEGSIAFVGGRVITITGETIKKGAVVVTGNKIAAVGKLGKVDIPDDAKRIDIRGKTLMPGFFDAHGHIDCCYYSGVMPTKQPTRYAALAYGVTTNFDPYSSHLTSFESGEMSLAGLNVSPRWLSSGKVLYGLAGRQDRTYHPINSPEDAEKILARRKALGPSILKSYKYPTRQERQWLLNAARDAGYMVDAEGAGQFYANITMLLDGHTNLEHNLPVPTYHDDLVQLFAASNMSVTPTLVVVFGELFGENYIYQTQQPWKDAKVRRFIPEVNNAYNPISGAYGAPLHVRGMQTIHVSDEIYDIGFRSVSRSVKKLQDAGVTVNVGSHGQASGIAIHWEMQLLAEGGMAPMEILRGATINGAKTYGLDHQLGSIEVGKLADLVVLDKNPLKDIRNANSVRLTMVNGRLYDAETMNEIGNYDRPRDRFYWEMDPGEGFDWNSAWSGE